MIETMDPEATLDLLEGVKDVLSQDFSEKTGRAKGVTCPRCGSACTPSSHPTAPFDGTGRLNLVAQCLGCGVVMDPDTGLTLSTG